jgi:dCMP deaminase
MALLGVKHERESWDQYFIKLAHAAATRATCPRRHVGCILVRDNRVISTGYNGSEPGADHCDDAGCLIDSSGSCRRTQHAERNAIARAKSYMRAGSTIYITDFPCVSCARLISRSGIVQVVFDRDYISVKRQGITEAYTFLDALDGEEREATQCDLDTKWAALDNWENEVLKLFEYHGIVLRKFGPG